MESNNQDVSKDDFIYCLYLAVIVALLAFLGASMTVV